MRYRGAIVLFLLSGILAGVYFGYLKPRFEERQRIADFEKQFFKADPESIAFIRIETSEGLVDVVRDQNAWIIEKPSRYRPDLQAVQKMLDALSRGRLIKVVGTAGERESYGLDRPNIIVSLGFSGKTDVLEIGGRSPTAAGFYAFNRTFGRVFLINEDFVRDFNLNLYDLRDKQLFPVNPGDIARIRIRRSKETIELAKTGQAWAMTSPDSAQASSDDVERLIQLLSIQRAAGFVAWDKALSKLSQRISIELFDSGQTLLDSAVVSYWGTEGDKGALVHRSGAPEAARTSRDFFYSLDSDASLYRYRNLFGASGSNIVKITVEENGRTALIENKNGWKMNGRAVPEKKAASLIEAVRTMKAVKVLREKRSLGMPTAAIEVHGDGESRLTVTNFNMDHEVSSTSALFVPIKPGQPGGRKKVDYWYALSRDLGTGVVVSSLDIQKIMDLVADLNRE